MSQNTQTVGASISLDGLKHALKTIAPLIHRISLVPVLQAVRMETIDGGIAFDATNLDTSIRVVLPELGGPDLPVLTPADKFRAYASLLTGTTVQITTDGAHAHLKCGRSKATLPNLSPANWPETATLFQLKGEGLTLTQGSFARALKFALLAVGEGASRPAITGVKLESDGERLSVVTTTGVS
ncbi:MAG: hypothetical protein KGN79_12390, partial [Acidobacteriota bacterium]|nr:hypothetical protein [Acidobacteriota bacterium]